MPKATKFKTLNVEPTMQTALEMLVIMHGGLSEVTKADSIEFAQLIAGQTLQQIQNIAFSAYPEVIIEEEETVIEEESKDDPFSKLNFHLGRAEEIAKDLFKNF
ncbi:MAG TPA: hypothetical protein PKY59_17015 [Pyrinomonadaceae bacterium]|nr:hypothetical protein [Pyrinomonadaceae bacterium]